MKYLLKASLGWLLLLLVVCTQAQQVAKTNPTKTKEQVIAQGSVLDVRGYDPSNPYALQNENQVSTAAEEQEVYKTIPQMEKAIARTKKEMERAARDLDFMEAARLRDEMFKMQKELEGMR